MPMPNAQRTLVIRRCKLGLMAIQELRERIIHAADQLFYARGTSNVGMDAVRTKAGASLKAIYKEFSSKEELIVAVLAYRHELWINGLAEETAGSQSARDRVLAIYDYLAKWFAKDDFRGCGFINAFGELGSTSPRVAEAVKLHKKSFQDYVGQLVVDAGWRAELGAQLAILAEGAQTSAAIAHDPSLAATARGAAQTLIDAAESDRQAALR